MRKTLNILLVCSVLLGAMFASCTSQKKLSYVREITAASADSVNANFTAQHEARIVCGDALTITVNALDMEAVEVFNMPIYSSARLGTDMLQTSYTLQHYTVDKDGNINFPVLGKVHAEGLTSSELRTLLETEISKSVNDPIVNISFINFYVTVLGEVNSPGRYQVTNERLTIFDALGMARDMTVYGKRDNVLVAREVEGKMQFERLNLNDASVYASPFFYLQQNDVVYVEPNANRAIASQNISLYLSMITTLGSMATVIVSVVRLNR